MESNGGVVTAVEYFVFSESKAVSECCHAGTLTGVQHPIMDHIRAIQELIDAHKEAMPTGVVTDLMKECRKAFKALPKLWKVTYIHVFIDGDNDLIPCKKTMIVEEVAALNAPRHWFQVFDTATIPPAEMHTSIGGDYATESRSTVRIVVKVEPFLKRARDDP